LVRYYTILPHLWKNGIERHQKLVLYVRFLLAHLQTSHTPARTIPPETGRDQIQASKQGEPEGDPHDLPHLVISFRSH